MSTPGNGDRISVSRDALRADLAEMELRLRVYFDAQLAHKADETVVLKHGIALDNLARGEFTVPQLRAIEDVVAKFQDTRTSRSWTNRERVFGLLMILVAIGSLAVTITAVTHHWG